MYSKLLSEFTESWAQIVVIQQKFCGFQERLWSEFVAFPDTFSFYGPVDRSIYMNPPYVAVRFLFVLRNFFFAFVELLMCIYLFDLDN